MKTEPNKTDTVCRVATSEDIEQIAGVMLQTLGVKSMEEAVTAIQNEMEQKHRFVVIENEGEIVGFATWILHGRPRHGLAELDHVATLPAHQGKGLARKLMGFLTDTLNSYYESEGYKLRKFFLLTRDTNTGAHEFYKKLGFTYETSLKSHFYPDRDEFVFSMFFDDPSAESK